MLSDGFYFLDGSTYRKFEARLIKLKKYIQSPITADDLTLRTDIGTPMPQLAEVVYVVDGVPIFHGVIYQPENKESYWEARCKSMQWLLKWRAFSAVVYHEATINQILASDAPNTTDDIPGALFRLNSEIPNGLWTAYSATVAKLAEGGLKSQMGAGSLYAYTTYPQATADGCDGVQPLTDAGSLPPGANQYYRDTDDLYVRLGDGSYLPNAFIVAALNKFDTKIRYKSCDIGTYKNTVDFSLFGQADTELSDLAERMGREIQFVPEIDGTVGMRLDDEISRGSAASPVRKFIDGQDGAVITISSDIEPDYQAAVTVPSDISTAPQAAVDWSPARIQLWKLDTVESPTVDQARDRLDAILDQESVQVKVTAPPDWHLRVGDWIWAYHPQFGQFKLRILEIEWVPGRMAISAGKKSYRASSMFGEYLRGEIRDDSDALSTTTIADPTDGEFVVKKEDVGDDLKIIYSESFSIADDDTAIDAGTFCDLILNGKVVPPGRIPLENGGSVEIDITEYCSMSASADTTNTIVRNLYRATGWTGQTAEVRQYKTLKFLEP